MGKFIDNLKKKFNFDGYEILGFILALCAAAIASFNYKYGFLNLKEATGRPQTMSGLFAFIFTVFLYWRGLIAFTNTNFIGRLVSIIVNVTVFATVFSLIINATETIEKDILFIITATACVTSLLLGMKGMAKLVVIVSLLILITRSLLNLEDAMGGWGFIYEILVFSSFYFQRNIKFSGLRDELKLLYGKATYTIKEAGKEAGSDLEKLGGELKGAVSSKITK